jgi:uncharacterized protein YukE
MGEVWGADLAQLRALAREFDTAAQTLDTAVGEVTSMLSSVDWLGPGGDQFRAEWDGHHAPTMRDVSSSLAEVRTKIERNADQQDETSNDYAGGIGGGTGGDDWPGGTGTGTVSAEDDGNWADWLTGVVGEGSWWATVGGVSQFGVDLLARGAYGVWGVADSVPGGLGGAIGAAGKFFAGASIAFGAFQFGQGIGSGDYWMAGDGAITAGFGAAGLLVAAGLVSNPVGWTILGVGAAWAVADIFIDGNVTETAWNGAKDAAGWAWDTGSDVVSGAAGLAGDALDAGGELLGDAGEAVGDAAGDVLDAGGDLIDGAKDLFSW